MTKIKTISSKLGLSAFALVFALGFGFGGAEVGVLPMARMVTGWWRAQSLVAVPARIEKLELKRHDGESTTWQVQGEFVYQYQGKEFRSHRINIGGDSIDNIGSYQKDRYAELQRAQTGGQNINLWVDPQQPEFAVVDRQIRLQRLLFLIPFAFLFPAVALVACWFLWVIWRKPVLDENRGDDLVWVQVLNPSPQRGLLKPEPSGALAAGLFAVVWNMLTLPLVLLALSDGGFGMRWLLLVFPLAGVLITYYAVRQAYLNWLVGKTALSTAQLLAVGISEARVRLHFFIPLGQRMRTPSMSYDAHISIECLYEDSRGEDTDTRTLWSESLPVITVAHAASCLDTSVNLPDNLPASTAWDGDSGKARQKVIWKLRIKILNHTLEFNLPVSHGVGQVPSPLMLAEMIRAPQRP
ncbi:DUF3592 domain-containing protein [Undibacterium sp. CY18W]|uniref:DUF3592 domain-containing protein n=1 Tax=Undibacterium hunanense TaxID=2762292 RepID=A0ABR6ZPP6_9BURK|nr:DUF3592 domain-containing protein [Undibacterium hunanense]MBC3917832.1 DUF3592 domain-containing protein [Undibacterium hunanense]